jgi:hypothetical protein
MPGSGARSSAARPLTGDSELSIDRTEQREHAAVNVTTEKHDIQKWHCHTKAEKLWIPDRHKMSAHTLKGLDALNGLYHGWGMRSVKQGNELRTIGEMEMRILRESGLEPEVEEIDGNLLMYGGASCQWQTLIGNGTATAAQSLTFFSNAQAAIGVGDSTTTAAATHTDLQAATNKLRVAMDATFPSHTDGVVVGAASIIFKSTFSTAQANWAWQEWAVFNSATAATGRMLQRKVESLGTKTSASTWALTITLSLA